jgi:hypothetical protein
VSNFKQAGEAAGGIKMSKSGLMKRQQPIVIIGGKLKKTRNSTMLIEYLTLDGWGSGKNRP